MKLASPSFAEGARIPARNTGDGEDVSPPLEWSGLPEGTVELALIVDDPDAPSPEPWVHWVVYGIPASRTGLPEGVEAGPRPPAVPGARQGRHSWKGGGLGYRGAAPPRGDGPHRYHFTLYAVGVPLDLDAGADKDALLAALQGRTLATARLTGVYER